MTKAEIEAHIDAIGAPATVLRPVFFVENWPYLVPETENGERVGSIALDADTPLQMIAPADIGRIALGHRIRRRGRPVHPEPFGMLQLTRFGSKTHSCSLMRNGTGPRSPPSASGTPAC